MLIGENPFLLVGGTGAIWIRTKEGEGTIRLRAIHPWLGTQTVDFACTPVPPETA